MRVWTAAALSAALLGGGATRARAWPATGGMPTGADLARGVVAPMAVKVTGLSVLPAGGRAEVLIAVTGDVRVTNFALATPHRVVVDLQGASLGMPKRAYDRVVRGPIANVRVAQFRPDVVRLVIDLDRKRDYTVTREGNAVRVSVQGGGEFAAWSSVAATSAVAAAPAMVPAAAPRAAAPRPAAPAAPVVPAKMPAPSAVADASVADAAVADAEPAEGPMSASAAASEMPVRRVAPPRPAGRRPQPRITVTYQDADIRDVLAAFATFSGRTIVVGRDIKGTVTAEIKDQPWDVALQAILQSQGLAAAEDANSIITVDSYSNIASKQASEPLVTQLVSVNYANAASLAGTVRSLLSKDCPSSEGGNGAAAFRSAAACITRGSIASDSSTNSLLITEVPSRLPALVSYVRDLDVRTPQVAIKAKIIFVNRTNILDLGLTYDLGRGTEQFFSQLIKRTDPGTRRPIDTDGDGVNDALGGGTPFVGDRVSLGGRAFSGLANANNRIQSPALNLIYSAALGNYQLTTFLDALQESRLADVQAEPNIVTLDNRRAEILVGQEIPLRVIDAGGGQGGGQGGQGGQGGAPRAQVQLKETGIILGVTPHITNNRQVLLNLHAENSNAEIASSDVGFVFNKQRADNQLLVGDGETAVIGGLTVTSISRNRTGIPFLSQLPVVGFLFGRTSKSESKQDLLILVTPHIVDEGERGGVERPGSR